ncbi:MAG: hypothetical protein HKN36_04090 [Hellea sp.]|nr:hypothetical protein [Hellea sp.]
MKFVTYNIQAAIGTKAYRHYFTEVGHQVFNTRKKTATLKKIAEFISNYDVACIQEIDLGGRRSGYKCQGDHLLELSDFNYIALQENRRVGNISKHGNAILSKFPLYDVHDLKLPGKRKGRGAIMASVDGPDKFHVVNGHFSLGLADQLDQARFLARAARPKRPLIIAGDFNSGSASTPVNLLADELDLRVLTKPNVKTYPSWNPWRDYDHILASPQISVDRIGSIDIRHSDHLPVEAEFKL